MNSNLMIEASRFRFRRRALKNMLPGFCAVVCWTFSGTSFGTSLSAGIPAKRPSPEWHIAPGASLITSWGRHVTPENAHREYPRPQLERKQWLNLNGIWQFAEARAGEKPPFQRELTGNILVPFPVESALGGVMKKTDRLWYRRTFQVPEGWRKKRVMLNFGAVDWEASVYVNGTQVGTHKGGYDPFSFDITDQLKPGVVQEIIVGVYDPTDAGEQPRGKQVRSPEGIWYTSTTGIWQTVWLEPLAFMHIADILITPEVEKSSVSITVQASGAQSGDSIRVSAISGNVTVGSGSTLPGDTLSITIPHAHLWSPSDPFLYDLHVKLERNGKVLDEVGSYFGMRNVRIGSDGSGITRILLNGQFVMQVGPLDQGFWPDGLYTPPSDEAMKSDIETMKMLGFNMARKHVKVEPERWYYWADRLGLLVWQDMPSAGNRTDEGKSQFESELGRLVATHRNHPSIIMWVLFNEGWGQYDTERLTAWLKKTDPTRLVNSASGWADKGTGDVLDIHSYPKPKSPKAEESRAIVLGEFGGLGLATAGHTWKKEHWGYQGMANRRELTSKYEVYMRTVYALKNDPGLSAAVYTQLTDVEVECNGLMTYDRAVLKPDLQRISAVNRGDFSMVPPPPAVYVVVPTSELNGQEWRYTFEKPPAGWFAPDFNYAEWKRGLGGFGTQATPNAVVRTEWKTPDIWMRREVSIPKGELTALHVRIHHDEDAEFYINGTLARKYAGYTSDYEDIPLSREAANLLKPGRNTFAIHCRQTKGGQYIDVGLEELTPASRHTPH
jgi:hypothetical protein